jgi:hypothetical protein
MLPTVPDSPRPVAFAISGFAMLGGARFRRRHGDAADDHKVGPGEGTPLEPLLVGGLGGIVAGAPFVGFAVLVAVLAGRRA